MIKTVTTSFVANSLVDLYIEEALVNITAKEVITNNTIQQFTLHYGSNITTNTSSATRTAVGMAEGLRLNFTGEVYLTNVRFEHQISTGTRQSQAFVRFNYLNGSTADSETFSTTSTSFVEQNAVNPFFDRPVASIQLFHQISATTSTSTVRNLSANQTIYTNTTNGFILIPSLLGSATYQFTSKQGYFEKRNIAVNISEGLNSIVISDIANARLSIFSFDPINGGNISNYSVLIRLPSFNYTLNSSVSGQNQTFELLSGFAYNITTSKTGYFSNSTLVSIVNQTQVYTSNMINRNIITVLFLDEDTRNPVTTVNFTIVSDTPGSQGFIGNTTNGTYSIQGYSGLFEIRYTADNYTQRSFFFSMPILQPEEANQSLFLLREDRANTFVITITDFANQYVDGLFGSLLRRYVVNGQTRFDVVEMFRPSEALSGTTVFTAVPNTEAYLFRVSNATGYVFFQGSATTSNNFQTSYLIDNILFLRVNVLANAFQRIDSNNNIVYSLTQTNNQTFWLSFSGKDSNIQQICLDVREDNRKTLGTVCSEESAGVLSFTIPNRNNDSFYVATAIASDTLGNTFSGNIVYIEPVDRGVSIFGALGLFMLLVTMILFAVTFASNPSVLVMSQVLCIFAFGLSFLGIIYISLALQGTLLVIGIITLIMLGR